jgi:hypothetical protein
MFMHGTVSNLAVCVVALCYANFAVAQQADTEPEKKLSAQIMCEDFTRTADGGWMTGPNVRVGSMVLSNTCISGPGGINISGADLVVVLNRKCGGQPL